LSESANEMGSLQEFVSSVPLYQPYNIIRERINDIFLNRHPPIDCYCIRCKANSIFTRNGTGTSINEYSRKEIFLECNRDKSHTIVLDAFINGTELLKYGQYPSLADIAVGELGNLRKAFNKQDAHDFTRAIGLSAHGVGIGAFVYLRRVFENQIQRRFEAHQDTIDREKYNKSRMSDKIDMLSAHLPEFLVQHKSIYGILSIGIHQLSEDLCRSAFPVMRDSIKMILEEDARALEEARRRAELSSSIGELGTFLAQKNLNGAVNDAQQE